MSVEIIISEARNGNPVLSVKSFNAGETYTVACRVNTWLERYCPNWEGYKSPARRDISVQGQFYCPIPLSYKGVTVAVFSIQALCEAMDKAGIEYKYISTHIGYVLPEAEEVDDIVYPFMGQDLGSMTKRQLVSLAKEHGVRVGSKFTKQQVVESLQDHYVVVA